MKNLKMIVFIKQKINDVIINFKFYYKYLKIIL